MRAAVFSIGSALGRASHPWLGRTRAPALTARLAAYRVTPARSHASVVRAAPPRAATASIRFMPPASHRRRAPTARAEACARGRASIAACGRGLASLRPRRMRARAHRGRSRVRVRTHRRGEAAAARRLPQDSSSMVRNLLDPARAGNASRGRAARHTQGARSPRCRAPFAERAISRRNRNSEDVLAGDLLDGAGSPRSGAGGQRVTRAADASRAGRVKSARSSNGRASYPEQPAALASPIAERAIPRRNRNIQDVLAGSLLDVAGSPRSGAGGQRVARRALARRTGAPRSPSARRGSAPRCGRGVPGERAGDVCRMAETPLLARTHRAAHMRSAHARDPRQARTGRPRSEVG